MSSRAEPTTRAEAFVTKLREQHGSAAVISDADAASYLTSWRGLFGGDALCVVRPASTTQTAQMVRACADEGLAIVPQGGNTGLSGGSVPANRGRTAVASGSRAGDTHKARVVLLSMTRMNRVTSVDPHRWTLTAEAGATIESVQQSARDHGLLFAPDWGARGTATVGGAISTDAGGNNVLRYGNMREQVLGVEAVLADGRTFNALRALRKDSSGYDLKHLFIGAEGTLGVVTRAVLRLHPPTPHVQSALAAISGLDCLMELLELASTCCGGTLSAFELIPLVGLDKVCDKFAIPRPLASRASFFVLMRLASTDPVSDLLGSLLTSASRRGLVDDAVVAVTEDQERRLWTIRDELPAMGLWPQQKYGLKLDTAVPIDRFGEYHEEVRRIAAELAPGALAYGFGHVGDGNLHMMVLPTSDDQVQPFLAVRSELRHRIDQATFAFGGTLSAEHGVGQLLRDRVEGQKSRVEWDLMWSIKKALDPQGIMNPDKLLPQARPAANPTS